jgi:hypothetical protein
MNIPTTTYARRETDHCTGQDISVLGDCTCKALLHDYSGTQNLLPTMSDGADFEEFVYSVLAETLGKCRFFSFSATFTAIQVLLSPEHLLAPRTVQIELLS